MTGINIAATGGYLPRLAVTNDDLSRIVETNDEWIRTRTGIGVRRLSDREPTWYMGAQASRQAIERAGISPEDIGLIVDCTITADFSTPSTACILQRELGAKNAACFDLAAACSGFVYALDLARRYLATDEELKYVLIAANENLSYITNFADRSTCILFGDGAAAVIVERSDKFFSAWTGSDGTGAKFLYAKNMHPLNPFVSDSPSDIDDGTDPAVTHRGLVQDGKEVYKFATKALPAAARKAAEKGNIDLSTVDRFVPHQANMRIIETAAKNLGVPLEKFYVNIEQHGNTSSASIPIAFDEAVTKGDIRRGERICFVGFGAGLTLGAVILDY